MENKEERIYISHYTKDVCSDCLHDYCYEGLCSCDYEYKNGITRQEAIEVMAKAIRLFLDNLQKNKDKVMPWYTTRDIAEVVLEGGNK